GPVPLDLLTLVPELHLPSAERLWLDQVVPRLTCDRHRDHPRREQDAGAMSVIFMSPTPLLCRQMCVTGMGSGTAKPIPRMELSARPSSALTAANCRSLERKISPMYRPTRTDCSHLRRGMPGGRSVGLEDLLAPSAAFWVRRGGDLRPARPGDGPQARFGPRPASGEGSAVRVWLDAQVA